MTRDTTTRAALVIAPHPDDETFGCGATILRKRAAGTPVHVCVVSDGSALRTAALGAEDLVQVRADNVRKACDILGVGSDALDLLGFPDGQLRHLRPQVCDALSAVIASVQPDEIFIPSSFDAHKDHVAVHDSASAAIGESGTNAAVYGYPVWFWARWTWSAATPSFRDKFLCRVRPVVAALRLRPKLVSTHSFLEAKREAMKVYSLEEPDREFFDRWHLMGQEFFFAGTAGGTGRF
jgi:LmbE family N-acetylglucosaminyl deacetylase